MLGVWRGNPQQVGDSNTVTLRNPKEPKVIGVRPAGEDGQPCQEPLRLLAQLLVAQTQGGLHAAVAGRQVGPVGSHDRQAALHPPQQHRKRQFGGLGSHQLDGQGHVVQHAADLPHLRPIPGPVPTAAHRPLHEQGMTGPRPQLRQSLAGQSPYPLPAGEEHGAGGRYPLHEPQHCRVPPHRLKVVQYQQGGNLPQASPQPGRPVAAHAAERLSCQRHAHLLDDGLRRAGRLQVHPGHAARIRPPPGVPFGQLAGQRRLADPPFAVQHHQPVSPQPGIDPGHLRSSAQEGLGSRRRVGRRRLWQAGHFLIWLRIAWRGSGEQVCLPALQVQHRHPPLVGVHEVAGEKAVGPRIPHRDVQRPPLLTGQCSVQVAHEAVGRLHLGRELHRYYRWRPGIQEGSRRPRQRVPFQRRRREAGAQYHQARRVGGEAVADLLGGHPLCPAALSLQGQGARQAVARQVHHVGPPVSEGAGQPVGGSWQGEKAQLQPARLPQRPGGAHEPLSHRLPVQQPLIQRLGDAG